MTLTIDIASETADQLAHTAANKGLTLAELVESILSDFAHANTEAGVRPRIRVLGRLADVGGSVDEFLQDKHEQTAAEEAKLGRRAA